MDLTLLAARFESQVKGRRMSGFLLFAATIFGIVMIFRFMRKREMEAFRDADLSDFAEFRDAHPEIESVQEEIPKPLGSNVIPIEFNASGLVKPVQVQGNVIYQRRRAVFDEFTREFLRILDEVVGEKYRILVHVPLRDFVRVEIPQPAGMLMRRSVNFLICDAKYMSVTCGIQLQGNSSSEQKETDFLETVFRQIERPLVVFPMVSSYSTMEVSEKLQDVIPVRSQLKRSCPKCGTEMFMRKAVKGKNAGRMFWVCKNFPDCKGIHRIGA